MKTDGDWMDKLPGGKLIREGLTDVTAGRRTVPACLVAIAHRRLSHAGLFPVLTAKPIIEPERELYRLLQQSNGDAYSRYNALLRELVSFENALDHQAAVRARAEETDH